MGSGKKAIADLPANVSVYPIETSKGYRYWRVLVGKRFTGGEIISKTSARFKRPESGFLEMPKN